MMKAERLGMACAITAMTLAWFLMLDILGVEPRIAILAWAVAAPALIQPVLGRLVRVVARREAAAAEEATSRRMTSLTAQLRSQVRQPIRTALDGCDRLIDRSRSGQLDLGRVSQEAAAIHYELMRVQDELARSGHNAAEPVGLTAATDELGPPRPRDEPRPVSGYVRRAVGLANQSRRS